MKPQRLSSKAIANAEKRAASLSGFTNEPYANVDLLELDPVDRFREVAMLDEWASFLGMRLEPDPEIELDKLRPLVAATKFTPNPEPTKGPVGEAVRKARAQLFRSSGEPYIASTAPTNHIPEVNEIVHRAIRRHCLTWVVYDGRPEQGATNARHAWFNDGHNLLVIAGRLGYEAIGKQR